MDQLQHARIDERCRNIIFRQKQLVILHKAVKEYGQQVTQLIQEEKSVNSAAAALEVYMALCEIESNFRSLDSGKKAMSHERERYTSKSSAVSTRREPFGAVSVLLKGVSNPFFDTIGCLSAIIAAGNVCLITLDGVSEAFGELLTKCISGLDQAAFMIATKNIETDIHFDVHFNVGRIGGSDGRFSSFSGVSPIVVDRTANLERTIQTISTVFQTTSKESSQSPRLIYVHEFHEKALRSGLVNQPSKSDFTIESFTSPEIAIDRINESAISTPVSSVYIFAEGDSVRYLSQEIHAPYKFANHIPTPWLIGSVPMGLPCNTKWRYRPELFSQETAFIPRPKNFNASEASDAHETRVAISKRKIVMPKRRPGKRVDFFLQGIFLFFGVTSITTIAALTAGGISIFRLYDKYSSHLRRA